MAARRNVLPLQDRLLDKVRIDPVRRCWIFTGHIMKDRYGKPSYGQIGIGNKKLALVHKVSYEMFCGPVPAGIQVCHKCDVRQCLNPTHLFLGTNTDNVKDALSKGRFSVAEKHYKTDLTNEQVADIKYRLSKVRSKRAHFPAIMAEFNVSFRVIEGIAYGSAWRSVEPCQASNAG